MKKGLVNPHHLIPPLDMPLKNTQADLKEGFLLYTKKCSLFVVCLLKTSSSELGLRSSLNFTNVVFMSMGACVPIIRKILKLLNS